MKISRKVGRWQEIVDEYSPILPSPLSAFAFKIAMKFKPLSNVPFVFHWGDMRFKGRPRDFYGSISDVLLEDDYAFILPILQKIPSQPVIVDLGANIGAFAIYALSIRDDAIIHSVEPSIDTFQLLKTNAALSQAQNWHVHQLAMWSEDGTVAFEVDQSVSSGNHVHTNGTAGTTYSVESIRLGSFMERYVGQDIDILKMDVEGVEEVVLAADEALLDRVRNLIIEIHPKQSDEQHVMDMIHNHFTSVQVLGRNEDGSTIVFAH